VYFYGVSISPDAEVAGDHGVPWDFCAAAILHGLLAPIVQVRRSTLPFDNAPDSFQAFFNYRVYALSKKLWLALPGWVLAVVQAGITPTIGILWGLKGIDWFRQHYNNLAYITFIASALVSELVLPFIAFFVERSTQADVWTATVLIWLLYTHGKVSKQ
jgi:hypothetical protein